MNSFETFFNVLREVYLKYLLHINKTNSLDSLLPNSASGTAWLHYQTYHDTLTFRILEISQ